MAVPALPAVAAVRSVSDVVLVDTGAVIDDDLYAAGNRVVVEGRVDGDLLVAAYEDVTITGTVTGDVVGVAGSVVVTGSVGESVRVVAPSIDISGDVGGDVLSVAWVADVAGEIGGGATLWAWSAELAGSVGGNLEGQMRDLALSGRIEDNVDVTATHLTVEPGTVVGRDLGYRSQATAVGIEEAEVGGAVVHRLPLAPNIRVRALVVLAKVVLGLLSAVVGLLVIWALPHTTQRAIDRLDRSWWRAWLRGLGVVLMPVMVLALAALLGRLSPTEVALPLLLTMLPLFVAVLGAVMVVVFAAPAAVYPWLGRLGNRQRGPVRAFLYAAAVVVTASLIPWVTWLVALVVIPIGVGGWLAAPSTEAEVPVVP